MSEKQTHTPGPWTNASIGIGSSATQVVWLGENTDKRIQVIGTGKDQANARLIAAAPELLEQCKLFEEVLCEFKVQSENCAYAEYAYHKLRENGIELDKLRKALAKVEGKTAT